MPTPHEKHILSQRPAQELRIHDAAHWALKVWKRGGMASLRFRGWV